MVKKIIVVIQARVMSERLKGKVFFNFFNETVIDRIIRIIKNTSFEKEIVIVSGNIEINKIFYEYSLKHRIKIYFGSELKRKKCIIEK